MASTYSGNLRIEKITDGEQSGTWGATTNTNWELVEDAISAVASVTHDDSAAYTLTATNGTADEARAMILEVGGTLTAARNLVCPTADKLYFVYNNTTGGFDFTIKTSAGTGITVANGAKRIVYCDGTDVVDALSTLAIADGGTGATDAGTARTNLGLGSIATQAAGAVAITGGTIGNLTALDVSGVSDTATAATHYYVEIATDGDVRPKTLANVQTEIVTTAAVNSAAATTVGTISSGVWNGTDIAVADGGTGASDAATALSNLGGIGAATSDTLTNKTIDADGTGNAISNIDIGNAIAATQQEAEAGVNDTKLVTPLKVAQAIAALASSGGGLNGVQVITTTGGVTYTPTAGTNSVVVYAVGGGGGGGNGADTCGSEFGGGGGGGGGAGMERHTSAFSGVTVTIGAGGAAASNGGSTTFGALTTATGGVGGASAAGCTGGAGGAGGSCSDGAIGIDGADGGHGGVESAESIGGGGRGGDASGSYGGGGGAGSKDPSNANLRATAGNLYGGGGGGGYTGTNGGGAAGANGVCVIFEYT